MSEEAEKHGAKLNQFFATAICGNDILSSALYVSGIAVIFAGIYAPLVLLLIAVVLYLYKAVYTEVVEALPINGGAYNCLLNGTSKTIAAIAGITTFLSYVATAVISAKVGVEYVNTVIPIPVIPVTIGLLGIFAILVITGLKDSAKVALGIFIFHILTLVTFLVVGLLFFLHGHSVYPQNLAATSAVLLKQGGFWKAMFFAFAASLLGVSGFESSANFVEEQQKGVFRKTLRNMLIGVAIFNPLVALVVINSLPLSAIAGAKDFLLADVAHAIGGTVLQYIVVADAFLVLSGAVLTAYVGVSGLLSRMASDACIPSWFGKRNGNGSYARIVGTFLVLCSSILIATGGDLLSLAGVYTIAFLGVMTLFGFGNLILRQSRTELKRTYHAPIVFVGLASIATFCGIIGNILIDPRNLSFFSIYFIPAITIIFAVVYQDYVMKFVIKVSRPIAPLHRYLVHHFSDMTKGRFVVFIRHPARLFSILDYINRNETGWNIELVTCLDPENPEMYEKIKAMLPHLHLAGVFPHFTVSIHHYPKLFGPDAIREVAEQFDVRINRIMIGSIHHFHEFDYDELGGVRVIF